MRAETSLGNLKGRTNGQVANSGPLSSACPFLNTHDSSFEMPAWWGSDAHSDRTCPAVKNISWQRQSQHSIQWKGPDSRTASQSPDCTAPVMYLNLNLQIKLNFISCFISSALSRQRSSRRTTSVKRDNCIASESLASTQNGVPMGKSETQLFSWAFQYCS